MRSAIGLLLVVGCASPMSALKDDNRRLSQTVAELRADRRVQDRKVRDLQRQVDLLRAQLVTAAVDGAMPSLPVEVASPIAAAPPGDPGSRVVGIADDGSEIVYEGDAAAGKVATLEDDPPPAPAPRAAPSARARGSRVDVVRAPAAARTARIATRDRETPGERSDAASSDYRAAVELVKSGNHADSVAALRAFLGKYPRHDYADNAQYWLGESYYAAKDYTRALAEFRAVIETYPRGNKVPDALLKVGYCYQALGQIEKSRAVLEQVVSLYPKTEPAATAAKRLETL